MTLDSTIARILLIRMRNIGDVLLAVPTIRAFRQQYPRADIAVLVNAGTEEMLTGNPLLNEVLIFDPRWKTMPWWKRLYYEGHFLMAIRKRRFDLAINLTEGDRGTVLARASGARVRVGIHNRKDRSFWWKKHLLHHWVAIPDIRAHTVEQILEVPRSLGIPEPEKKVDIYFSLADQERIDRLLLEEGIGPESPLVHIHPTSRWLFKCWRDEGMAEVIDRLEETGRVRVVLTGGDDQKELRKIGSILRLCRTHPVSLAGKITLKQLAALSRRSLFFLGVDTAPMHIAAAVGTPVIAIFGPSGEFNWGPWGEGHTVIKKDLACRPCGRDGCEGTKKSRCLEEISTAEVLQEAFRFLARLEATKKARWA